MNQELIGLLIGFTLTLFIYSYVVGDNPLYRLAAHLLVGVSAAYAAIIVLRQVILPVLVRLQQNPTAPDNALWLIPLLFALLLLFKRLPVLRWLGNSSLAFLVGVGAAVALVGAIRGTLLPQVTAVGGATPVQGLLIALLTVCTLMVFQFTGGRQENGDWKRPFWQRGPALIGRAVLTITFGALFAGLLSTSVVLLTERVSFFLNQLLQLLS